MRSNLSLRRTVAAFALLTAIACDDATAPLDPDVPAGVYVLDHVSGRGPVSGSFVLTNDGRATRRVRFATTPTEDVQVGSFEVSPHHIVFTLHPADRPADYVWSVRGDLTASGFSIHYPDPADGPDIVETFRR